jgi:hypothetical protein
MLVSLPENFTLVRFTQELKTPLPRLVTLSGMVRLVNPEQLLNALSPMLVTLLGIQNS